ncbi:MAG: hypothetical protein O3A10_07305 [Chloroflexi bacterium]|nr:hypothetical protein [Chloroflexota bacterium]MDA1146109.1 hypothetical protein [Chloroflexota bacterium]
MAVRPFPEQHRRQHRIGIWLALSALFVVVELLLVRPEVAGSPRPALLADVMALDLALGLPLLGYALVIRGGYVSAAVLPLLLLASTGLAFLAVPEGGGRVLPVLIVVAPALTADATIVATATATEEPAMIQAPPQHLSICPDGTALSGPVKVDAAGVRVLTAEGNEINADTDEPFACR